MQMKSLLNQTPENGGVKADYDNATKWYVNLKLSVDFRAYKIVQ